MMNLDTINKEKIEKEFFDIREDGANWELGVNNYTSWLGIANQIINSSQEYCRVFYLLPKINENSPIEYREMGFSIKEKIVKKSDFLI